MITTQLPTYGDLLYLLTELHKRAASSLADEAGHYTREDSKLLAKVLKTIDAATPRPR